MRKPSDTLNGLLNQLYSPLSLYQRLFNPTTMLCSVLKDIAELRESAAIPYLIQFAFHASSEVAMTAENTINSLLTTIDDTDLVCLDEKIRSCSIWYNSGRWSLMQPNEVTQLTINKRLPISILGLITCHRNGRVRQESLNLLGEIGDRAAIPFLLLRVNDWVPNVRYAALKIVHNWLREGPFEEFLPHLYLVFRLLECKRADSSNFVELVVQHLLSHEHEPFLLDIIRHSDRKLARHLFAEILANQKQTTQIILSGLESDDVIIRSWATDAVPTVFSGQELIALLTRIRTDSFTAVRNKAILLWLSLFPESAISVLVQSLFDRSIAIRELAAFHLKKQGDHDVAFHYRKALQEGQYIALAILGLGETGSNSDVPIIRSRLRSRVTAERKAAVTALARLAGKECLNDFLCCLSDDNPKIARTAAKWLSCNTHLLNLKEIMSLCLRDDRRHVRLAALSILNELNTWEALPYLIHAAAGNDIIVRTQAQRYIERRFNRVFMKPSKEQEIIIDDALQSGRVNLDRLFLTELEQWLLALGISIETDIEIKQR